MIQRFNYLGLIVRFTIVRVVRGNEILIALSVILGIAGRILALLGFAATLHAILATIHPETAQRLLNAAAQKFRLGVTVSSEAVAPIVLGIVLIIFASNWVLQAIRSRLLFTINMRIYQALGNFAEGRTIEDDLFLIEKVPMAAQATERVLETSVFILFVIMLISLLVPTLALLMLPLLSMLVIFNVFGDKKRLRELKMYEVARREYLNPLGGNGKRQRRLAPEDGVARHAYLAIREQRRHHKVIKPQVEIFAGAIVLSIVVIYLLEARLSADRFAGILVFFLIGIRNVISAGRELSTSFSQVLDLRQNLHQIRRDLELSFSGGGCVVVSQKVDSGAGETDRGVM